MKQIDWFEQIEEAAEEFASQATLNFAQRGARKY